MLKLDSITLTHLIGKGMMKEFQWRRGRNVLWCVEDGGRGVCSSDNNGLTSTVRQAQSYPNSGRELTSLRDVPASVCSIL